MPMPMPNYNFVAAVDRIKKTAGVTTQTGLAIFLHVSQASVWDAIRRGEGIPAGWLVTMVERYGISPRWIKTGDGPQYTGREISDYTFAELLGEVGRRLDAHTRFGKEV